MTPEQIKFKEFPVRIKGYDTEAVRAFLDRVAAAFRAATTDDGDHHIVVTDTDLVGVLAGAHDAASKVLEDAQREADAIVAKAEAFTASQRQEATADAEKAREILQRAQDRRDAIGEDCRRAQSVLSDAESQAEALRSLAQADASKVVLTDQARQWATAIQDRVEAEAAERIAAIDEAAEAKMAELDQYVATNKRQANRDRSAAKEVLGRAEHKAKAIVGRAEDKAQDITKIAEREARSRIDQLRQEAQQQAAELQEAAKAQAKQHVTEIVAAARVRLDELDAEERMLQERIDRARRELSPVPLDDNDNNSDTIIDLTEWDLLVSLDGTYQTDDQDDELVNRMVTSAVSHAAENG
jgi:DivIVA domain-containing protein